MFNLTNPEELSFDSLLLQFISKEDIDSSKYIEYVSAVRHIHGLNTGMFSYRLPNSNEHLIDTLIDELSKVVNVKFDFEFTSDSVFRGIAYERKTPVKVPMAVVHLCRFSDDDPYTIVAMGDKEIIGRLKTHFKKNFKEPDITRVFKVIGLNKDGSLATINEPLDTADSDKAFNEFYPRLGIDVETIGTEFMNSKNGNVMVFTGSPGTGKSTLIRTIMDKARLIKDGEARKIKKIGICNSEMALNSPEITTWMGQFAGGLVVIEGADTFVMSRDRGNPQMSAILDLADGTIRSGVKILLSTNLPTLNMIDSALLRYGRCFGVFSFTPLDTPEANKARVAAGLPGNLTGSKKNDLSDCTKL